MVKTLVRNKIKNPFFEMSTTPPLSLVSTTLSSRFYELNDAQSYFPALSSNFPLFSLEQFDNIMHLKHWAWFQWRPTRVFTSKSIFSCWIMLPWILGYFSPPQMFPINLFNTLKREIRGKTNIKQLKYKTKHTKLEDITR